MIELGEREILERVQELSGVEFERFVAALWELQGWTTEITDRSGDDGRDIIAERNLPFEITIKIEAKGWGEDNKVPSPKIRQYALLPGDDAEHAVVVTSSSFTDPAIRSAEKHNIKLVNSARLVTLIQKLDAEALLTDDLAVDDWEQVWSGKHLDWAVDGLEESNAVDAIPGIGPRRAEELAAVDIYTTDDLLIAEPADLANKTTFAKSRLQRWVNLATYYKGAERTTVIDGIGHQEAEQLAQANIYTVDDLVAASPKEVAAQTGFDERTLKQWVGDAAYRDATWVTDLPKIGDERAKELAKAGIFTISDLADADPERVMSQADLGKAFLQDRIQKARTH